MFIAYTTLSNWSNEISTISWKRQVIHITGKWGKQQFYENLSWGENNFCESMPLKIRKHQHRGHIRCPFYHDESHSISFYNITYHLITPFQPRFDHAYLYDSNIVRYFVFINFFGGVRSSLQFLHGVIGAANTIQYSKVSVHVINVNIKPSLYPPILPIKGITGLVLF